MNGSNEKRVQPQLPIEAPFGSPAPTSKPVWAQPLSSAQQRILRRSQSDRSPGLRTRIDMRLRGPLNKNALRSALDRIVARHEILRTTFGSEDGKLIQRVGTPDTGFALEEYARQPNRSPPDKSLDALSQLGALASFDLSQGPLIRGRLVEVDELEHALTIEQHPIIADIWSVGVLIRELTALYSAYCGGEADPLPPLDRQFADFARWEREEMSGEKLRWRREHWARVFAEMPERLSLPGKRSRAATAVFATERVPVRLSPELHAQLQALAHRKEIPLFVPLLCGWAVLLGRCAGQEDVVIGARMPNRPSPELERLIGPFENLIPLRVRFPGDTTVDQLLKKVKTILRKGRSHQDLPFEQVAEDLSQASADPPALQVVMNVNATPQEVTGCRALRLPGLEISDVSVEALNSPFELSLSMDEGPHGLVGSLEYAKDLFERQTIERLLAGWEVLLGEMVTDLHQTVSRLPIMTAADKNQVVVELNRTAAPYPRDKLIHELFEEQVEGMPEAVAVEHEGRRLTYGQLNRRANQLARYLSSEGVCPDQVVGICVERSLEMVVGLLAILKAGGAYLPLDPNYPSERLQQMLEDAAPGVVLSETELMGVLPANQAKVIALDQKLGQIAGFIDENLQPKELGANSESLVYVIYTSGSTGQPKGTAMRHRSVVNLIEWHRRSFGDQKGCRTLQFAALSFDVAFQEIFSTLCTGGTLVLLDEWVRRDAKALTELLVKGSIERLFVPPLMLQSIAEHCKSAEQVPASLKDVITAGEQLRISPEVRDLFGRLEGCRLHNHYGPTETHVVTTLTLERDPGQWPELPPIGRPIANTQIYVLDGQMQPVPIGVTGEIYIGGANVALGYLKRPELTEQRFVADPYSTDPGARLYKSGDLGRWRADGVLECLGRNDDQVKIRGFRVELGEIEAQLARHAQLRQAAVIAREDAPGQKRLVAYVTAREQKSRSPEALRAHLRAVLPEHMVPSAFVTLENLPLTPSGKLDRKSLPAPDIEAYVSCEYQSPVGAVEQILAEIWREILQLERIGRNDNFFELGGHSLLAVRMFERLHRFHFMAEVRHLYEKPLLTDFARTVRSESQDELPVPPNAIPPLCTAITPQMLPLVELEPEHIARIVRTVPGGAANVQDIYPLAPLQEGLLFHHNLDHGAGDTYVLPMLLRLDSRERLDALAAALQRLIDRHDILRTAVQWEHLPRPVQVVYRRASLQVEEVALVRDEPVIEQFKDRMGPQQQRLDMRQAPLMRLQVAADADSGAWYALLQLHHFAGDHESVESMFSEIESDLDGRLDNIPLPGAYRDHIAQAIFTARKCKAEADAFFRAKLATVYDTTAPFGLLNIRGNGGRIDQAFKTLDGRLSSRLRAHARRLGVSSATIFHAVWALVVAQTSGRDDVVYGTVLLGRLQCAATSRNALGMFINTLPLRLQLEGVTTEELVRQTHRELGELLEYEQASLADAQSESGVPASSPLFTALLNYRYVTLPFETGQPTIAPGVRLISSHEWTNYPVVLSVDDGADNFVLTAQTDRAVDPLRLLEYMSFALQSFAEGIEVNPTRMALELQIMPEWERQRVVETFNNTETSYPSDKAVHELFEAQAVRSPDAVALVCTQGKSTYKQLNAIANRWAHYLTGKGARGRENIAIVLPRGPEMITMQLAVLKVGCAYVPIDPTLPAERQRFMIHDCNARYVVGLGTPSVLEDLRDSPDWIDFDLPAANFQEYSEENPDRQASPNDPAYIMYTSGSTGAPKGVIIPHRAVVRLVINSGYAEIRTTDCLAHTSNPAFDASTFEVWGALLNGARIAVVPQPVVLDGRRLADLIRQEAVTVLWMTAGLFVQHADVFQEVLPQLRYLLTGGDVVDPNSVRRVLGGISKGHLLNAYGPTECTTFTTTYRIEALDESTNSIPIGRPIANTRVYILNSRLEPVPIGARGEIFIGGAGVALGYLNRPELTADQFLSDPFSKKAGDQLYRTGDIGRWRSDGAIEFLGRRDSQVKVRGYRIELGEIEARLLEHPEVREAVVIAREDEGGEKRLAAYVVPDSFKSRTGSNDTSPGKELVKQWNILYEETYSAGPEGPSFVGWNSSYTGQAIPEPEMEEWLKWTVRRIQSLRPSRVLEIGCGVGLLVHHLSSACPTYVGTDFSAAAVAGLRRWIAKRPELQHVDIVHGDATALNDYEDDAFDTVILNSVVQYFPDIDYLMQVLRAAVRVTGPGGKIFVGDVRNLQTLEMFHSAVQLARAGATVRVAQLKRRIARAISQDKELVIDPLFFSALVGRVPGITAVDVEMKRGQAVNELSRYRYDVTLSVKRQSICRPERPALQWAAVGSCGQLEERLGKRDWPEVQLRSIPNARLTRDAAALRLINGSEDEVEVSALRRRLDAAEKVGVEPEEVCRLAEMRTYIPRITWDMQSPECFRVELSDRRTPGEAAFTTEESGHDAKPWREYANEPLENAFRQQAIPRLRDYLAERLPDYMVPSAWVILRQLPLTPNGKVDRRALPPPQNRPEEMGEYVAPRTVLEETLTRIWAQVLRVDQVGIEDNFFELGGHSLLATQVMVRVQSALSLDVPVRLIFDYPTVANLARQIDGMRDATLLEEVEGGGDEIADLLATVGSMTDAEARLMLKRLSAESRS